MVWNRMIAICESKYAHASQPRVHNSLEVGFQLNDFTTWYFQKELIY